VDAQFELIMLEYEKLRDESVQSMQAQQAILQWSIASFGAILGAALILASQDPNSWLSAPVAFAVFGVAVPAFVLMCCLAWFGELIRMERIGVYLRGIEFEVAHVLRAQATSPNNTAPVLPLRWETYIAFSGKRAVGVTKQKVGYFGSVGIYSLVMVASLATAMWRLWLPRAFAEQPLLEWLLTAAACLELLFYVATVLYLARGLIKAARRIAPLGGVEPATEGLFVREDYRTD
jgi:hypothetical protein